VYTGNSQGRQVRVKPDGQSRKELAKERKERKLGKLINFAEIGGNMHHWLRDGRLWQ